MIRSHRSSAALATFFACFAARFSTSFRSRLSFAIVVFFLVLEAMGSSRLAHVLPVTPPA